MSEIIFAYAIGLALMLNGSIGWTLYYKSKNRKKQLIITIVSTILVAVLFIATIVWHLRMGS